MSGPATSNTQKDINKYKSYGQEVVYILRRSMAMKEPIFIEVKLASQLSVKNSRTKCWQGDTVNNTTTGFLMYVIIRNQDIKKLETKCFGLTLAIFRFHLEKADRKIYYTINANVRWC